MAARKPFKVQSREEGRGRISTNSFATLKEAQDFIASHWQGPDYVDGEAKFHTDYSDFNCVGFVLADIIEFYFVEIENSYDCHWKDLDGKRYSVVSWMEDEDRPQKATLASFVTLEEAIADAIKRCSEHVQFGVEADGKSIGWAVDKQWIEDVPFEQVAFPDEHESSPF